MSVPEPGSAPLDRLLLAARQWEADGQQDDPSSGLYPTLLGIFGKDPTPEPDFDLDGWRFDEDGRYVVTGAWIPGDARPPELVELPDASPLLALGAEEPAAGVGPVVGILDTRICPHPALAGSYAAPGAVYRDIGQLDEVEPPGLDPFAPHATFLAGIIAQQAPAARILVRPVIQQGRATLADVLRGLVELREAGAQIINLSLGTYTDEDREPALLDAIVRLLGPDVIVVAAAGNRPTGCRPRADDPRAEQDAHAEERAGRPEADPGRPGRPWWPAALEGVVAVGSATDDGAGGWVPSEFSNLGPWVNVWAPGDGVVSTFVDFPDDGREVSEKDPRSWTWATWSGTSFAAAVVSGRIAERMSAARAAGNPMSSWQAFSSLVRDASADVRLDGQEAGGTRLIEARGPGARLGTG